MRSRRARAAAVLAAFLLPAVLALAGCRPETKQFGGTITGVVLYSGASPAGLVTVYLQDPDDGRKAEGVDGLSASNGRFRLAAPAGRWTVVATDFQGFAAFFYDVRVRNGAVVDVGELYLQPCAAPGSGTNGEVYEECPDPENDDLGYGPPPPTFDLDTFAPEYTDATLSVHADSSYDTLQVYSYAGQANAQLDLQIPADSPYLTVGTHTIPEGSADFFATLYELNSNVFYVMRTGTFVVEQLQLQAGGAFRARLRDAVFDWYDYQSGGLDGSFTATLANTSPAMSDSISVIQGDGPSGTPPGQSYSFATLEPEFTQLYCNGGGITVGTYDTIGGEYVQLFLEVPPELNAPGTYSIQNEYGQKTNAWNVQLPATAIYGGGSFEYQYALGSATWTVLDAGTGGGDGFSARLDAATFLWQQDPGMPPYSTLTLYIGTSGLLTGTCDSFDGGGARNWNELKSGLLVNLGG